MTSTLTRPPEAASVPNGGDTAGSRPEPGTLLTTGDHKRLGLLFIYGGGDDYLEVGCPADAPKVCRGRARVTWRGRTLLAGRVRVRRNRIGLVDIRLTRVGRRVLRTRLVGVSIRVETRDRSGRLQVRRTKAAIEEGEVDNGPDK